MKENNLKNTYFLAYGAAIAAIYVALTMAFQPINIHVENPYVFSMIRNISCFNLLFFERRKGHIYAAYADNFFLPFALLAASTFLPPAVLILDLKPCTLALCLFFGWNVIFMDIHLLILFQGACPPNFHKTSSLII